MANDMFLNNHIIQIKKLCILFDNLGALTTGFFLFLSYTFDNLFYVMKAYKMINRMPIYRMVFFTQKKEANGF